MSANNTRESKVSKSQEDPEDHETYNYNRYSDGDTENEDIWDYSDVQDIIHYVDKDPSEFLD
jgi:hypothetical protein